MMSSLKSWFIALSSREKIMVAAAGVLAACVIGVYAITLPLLGAIQSKQLEYNAALERKAAIISQVQSASGAKTNVRSLPSGPVQQLISQSAIEAGFAIDRADAKGADRVEFVMAKAKPNALMTWLNDWEEQGLLVERLDIKAGIDGTVAVTATLARPAE
jgi:general secretion pathway protein M